MFLHYLTHLLQFYYNCNFIYYLLQLHMFGDLDVLDVLMFKPSRQRMVSTSHYSMNMNLQRLSLGAGIR